jgi:hypothetical protein
LPVPQRRSAGTELVNPLALVSPSKALLIIAIFELDHVEQMKYSGASGQN